VGGQYESMQFEASSESYKDVGTLVVFCLEEKEGGISHLENDNNFKLTFE